MCTYLELRLHFVQIHRSIYKSFRIICMYIAVIIILCIYLYILYYIIHIKLNIYIYEKDTFVDVYIYMCMCPEWGLSTFRVKPKTKEIVNTRQNYLQLHIAECDIKKNGEVLSLSSFCSVKHINTYICTIHSYTLIYVCICMVYPIYIHLKM